MAGDGASSTRARTRARYCFLAFGAVFLLFAANVLAGKAQITFDWRAPLLLNDVSEYLLLMVAALLFTLGTLFRERAAEETGDAGNRDNDPQGRNP